MAERPGCLRVELADHSAGCDQSRSSTIQFLPAGSNQVGNAGADRRTESGISLFSQLAAGGGRIGQAGPALVASSEHVAHLPAVAINRSALRMRQLLGAFHVCNAYGEQSCD